MEATLAVRMGMEKTWGIALSRSWGRRLDTMLRRPLGALLVGIVIVTGGTTTRGIITISNGPRMSVIVRAASGAEGAVERAVERLGGTVGARLRIIEGLVAVVPSGSLPVLRALPGVVSVTPNFAMRPLSDNYDPGTDVNSMYVTTQYTGAERFWQAGYTGLGIDVAIIDSGVSPVEGLSAPGKIIHGPDLSLESQAPNLTRLDTYGHGTFMAGLIAGRDTQMVAPYDQAPASQYRGMAPDARIVSVKVATADGGTDVSQVIAAIDWVVQHAHDPGLNIRILNLSYGTNSVQSYVADPLAYAAETAWKRGIVVVAAAGNLGFQRSHGAPALADPAYDPYIMAVGASDSNDTTSLSDDTVCTFSAAAKWGNARAPDFLAPGAHIQGLRVPNSYLDANHPEGIIDSRYFRGSGTSESAAIASGAAALVLSKFPSLAPDQVKNLIQAGAYKFLSINSGRQGSGELQLTQLLSMTPTNYVQDFVDATGTGLLEAARGTDHIAHDGVVLAGEQDIFGQTFVSSSMASLEAAGSSWSGGTWNGNSWSGSSWSGSSWSGNSWSGSSWSGSSWSGSSWSGNSWSGSSWSGSSWSGSSWSGNSWSGKSWSGYSWAGDSWG